MPVLRFLGFSMLYVGFLIVKDPNSLLEPQHSTWLPGIVGCNLMYLVCEELGRIYGFEPFKKFN